MLTKEPLSCFGVKFQRSSRSFLKNLHGWQEFYTTAGRTGRAKYQLCLHVTNQSEGSSFNESNSVAPRSDGVCDTPEFDHWCRSSAEVHAQGLNWSPCANQPTPARKQTCVIEGNEDEQRLFKRDV